MTDFDKSLVADKEISGFRIFKDENSAIAANIGPRHFPLKALVASLLYCNGENLQEHPKIRQHQPKLYIDPLLYSFLIFEISKFIS